MRKNRICNIDTCNNPHYCKGWCIKHYSRWLKHGDPKKTLWKSLRDKFENKYIPVTESGCWIWLGATFKRGYGQLRVNYKSVKAHRVSWELHNGPIPEGLCVLHKCDIPSCVNPNHLFLGTYADNNIDRTNKNRSAIGESHGHSKLTKNDILEIRKSNKSYGAIAKKYGVAKTTIRRIKVNITWTHI